MGNWCWFCGLILFFLESCCILGASGEWEGLINQFVYFFFFLIAVCGSQGNASQQLQERSGSGSSDPRSWCLSDAHKSPARPGSLTEDSVRGAKRKWAVQEDLWPGNDPEALGKMLWRTAFLPWLGGAFLLHVYLQFPLNITTLESGLWESWFLKITPFGR